MSRPAEVIIVIGNPPPGGGRAAYAPLNTEDSAELRVRVVNKPAGMSVADALRAALVEIEGNLTE